MNQIRRVPGKEKKMTKETISNQLKYLGLKFLEKNWEICLKQAEKKQTSYVKFLDIPVCQTAQT